MLLTEQESLDMKELDMKELDKDILVVHNIAKCVDDFLKKQNPSIGKIL